MSTLIFDITSVWYRSTGFHINLLTAAYINLANFGLLKGHYSEMLQNKHWLSNLAEIIFLNKLSPKLMMIRLKLFEIDNGLGLFCHLYSSITIIEEH